MFLTAACENWRFRAKNLNCFSIILQHYWVNSKKAERNYYIYMQMLIYSSIYHLFVWRAILLCSLSYRVTMDLNVFLQLLSADNYLFHASSYNYFPPIANYSDLENSFLPIYGIFLRNYLYLCIYWVKPRIE